MERWEQIEEVKNGYAELSKAEIAAKYVEFKNFVARQEAKISVVNLHLEALAKLIFETLEASREEKFTTSGGGTFYIKDRVYISVKDKAAFRKWAMENGYEDQFTLHHKTVESIANEKLLKNQELPPGLDAYSDPGIGTLNILDKGTAND